MSVFTPTDQPVITGLAVRAALVAELNERHAGTDQESGAPLGLINAAMRALGLPPVIERVTATVVVPVRKEWEGEIEIELSDHSDLVLEAVESEFVSEEDIEDLDVEDPGSTWVLVTTDVTARLRRRVTVDLPADDSLEDVLADEIDVDGSDWAVDSTAEVEQIVSREFV